MAPGLEWRRASEAIQSRLLVCDGGGGDGDDDDGDDCVC